MKCRKPCVYCDYWEIREHEYVTPDGESHTEEYHVCTKPRDKETKRMYRDTMHKPNYYIVSFSGGKDSTAMLLHLLELGEPIDEILFCDTTMEFPEMYVHIEKVKKDIERYGVKFTTLNPPHDFEYFY